MEGPGQNAEQADCRNNVHILVAELWNREEQTQQEHRQDKRQERVDGIGNSRVDRRSGPQKADGQHGDREQAGKHIRAKPGIGPQTLDDHQHDER